MFIATIKNRNSPPAHLLREGYRQGGKVKTRTLANLSRLPAGTIEALKAALKGTPAVAEPVAEASLPHGHVLAVVTMIRNLGLDTLLHGRRHRMRELSLAMIAGRILVPPGGAALIQSLAEGAEQSTLGQVLGLGRLGRPPGPGEPGLPWEARAEAELATARDWLLERQKRVEDALAGRHLHPGSAVLYGLHSGQRQGPGLPRLPSLGWDGPRISYGLLCTAEGIPVAIAAAEAGPDHRDPLAVQMRDLHQRFHLDRVEQAGDWNLRLACRGWARAADGFDPAAPWAPPPRRPAADRENRIRGHLFVAMLAYYVEWHLRAAWGELLGPEGGAALGGALPLQTFPGLMRNLAALARVRIRLGACGPVYTRSSRPTALQARALELIAAPIE